MNDNIVGRHMRVLIAAAEFAPLAKTGGLADFAGSLPGELRRMGIDARVVIPLHRTLWDEHRAEITFLTGFQISLGWRRQYAAICTMEHGGVPLYLIGSRRHFGGAIYRGGEAEGEQYAFFQRAVLEMLERIDFLPDIIHCSDWHTAMIPMLLKTQYQNDRRRDIRTLLTIHNLAYQGRYAPSFVSDILSVPESYLTDEYMTLDGSACFMKAGCVFADCVNTVSRSYAREITTPEYGEGLDGILRTRGVFGILNGIDRQLYDPKNDGALPCQLKDELRSWKTECRRALCSELELAPPEGRPLIGMVTRLTGQKGIELLESSIDALMDRDVRFVIAGEGEKELERRLLQVQSRYPHRFRVQLAHNDSLARRIYAGADIFLMPSRFEPCGIAQLIAMRYGAVSVVRRTGGLCDTVIPFDSQTGRGCGFLFSEYSSRAMTDGVLRAVSLFDSDKTGWDTAAKNAMAEYHSFTQSAAEYAALYAGLV